ncbi:hypothetical protein VTJ49DRAFT_815 [Mycothermus thermophilus]|uniref:Pectate lyase domain-containing protein n=1 Tax=Humicola insolens TaxID=85995 RepID=A0ABR3VE28_HUMIN
MRLLALASFVALTAAAPAPAPVLSSTATDPVPSATPTDTEPGPPLQLKAASISDVANLGFATLNGGTTGGAGGNVTVVSTLSEFTAAVSEKNPEPAIVVINGTIVGDAKVRIGSNKTIIGLPGSGFVGVGLYFKRQRNLILRNIVASFVEAKNGDVLGIDGSTNVWVDHCEFYSSLAADKDFHDGLVDATHGADYITISHTYFHDHWKGSLVGHNDDNAAEDQGKLHITYANNHWKNVNSRGPLFRFGTGHIYNSMSTGINTRMNAQLLIQNNVFRNVPLPITSRDSREVG